MREFLDTWCSVDTKSNTLWIFIESVGLLMNLYLYPIIWIPSDYVWLSLYNNRWQGTNARKLSELFIIIVNTAYSREAKDSATNRISNIVLECSFDQGLVYTLYRYVEVMFIQTQGQVISHFTGNAIILSKLFFLLVILLTPNALTLWCKKITINYVKRVGCY